MKKTFSPSTIILSNHSVSDVSLPSFYKKNKKMCKKKIAQSIFVKAFSSQLSLILSKVRRYICDIYDHHHHRYCHLPSNKHHQTQLCFEIKMLFKVDSSERSWMQLISVASLCRLSSRNGFSESIHRKQIKLLNLSLI